MIYSLNRTGDLLNELLDLGDSKWPASTSNARRHNHFVLKYSAWLYIDCRYLDGH